MKSHRLCTAITLDIQGIYMSLANKMKLQDLKAKIEEFSAPRRELLNKQINDAATAIQKDVLEFFKSQFQFLCL